MMKRRDILSAAVLAAMMLTASAANAQQRRVTNAKMVAVGYTDVQDTYLSPECYGGTEIRYVSHTLRERDSLRWSRIIVNEGGMSIGKSRSGNGATMSGTYHFQYGAVRSWSLMDGHMRLSAGVQGELTAGFIYNTRNGNNPSQARLALDMGPMARAEYSLGRTRLAYEASCPLLGVCFSPNYGQSYYEIFGRGNYDHNVVVTTIGSTPSLRHTLTADVPFLGVTWRVGYLGDYRQQHVNRLKQHLYTSALMIGVVIRR